MYKRVLCALSAMILTLCITGCKSTPGDSLIVNKTDDNINSLIGQHADGPVITDGHIKETITCCGDRVLANVDADIKSKFDYYGVYEIKRKEITQQQVDKAIEMLYGDRKIFNYRGETLTKEKYDFYINKNKTELQDMKNNPKKYEDELKKLGDEAAYKTVEEWMNVYEKTLKEDIEAQKTAPTENELKNKLNTKLHYPNEKDDDMVSNTVKSVMVSAELGYTNDSLFAVQVPDNQLEIPIMLSYKNGSDVGERTINTVTQEKAEKIAEEFALAMDSSFVLTYSGVRDDCYEFDFSVTADGMPITEVKCMSEYAYNWNLGRITINVDDSGICAIDWTQPIEVVKKVTDKVEMITAEEAYEIFARYFKLKYASDSIYEYGIEKQIFDLYEISVSYVIEPIKDNTDAARVMPCWNFICKHTVKFNDGTPDNIAVKASIFAINAIDKSIIL